MTQETYQSKDAQSETSILPTLRNVANPDNGFLSRSPAEKLLKSNVALYQLIVLFLREHHTANGRMEELPPLELSPEEVILDQRGGWVLEEPASKPQ